MQRVNFLCAQSLVLWAAAALADSESPILRFSLRALLFCNRTRTTRRQPQEVTMSSRIIHDGGFTRSHICHSEPRIKFIVSVIF
jgi:hypothetical protein